VNEQEKLEIARIFVEEKIDRDLIKLEEDYKMLNQEIESLRDEIQELQVKAGDTYTTIQSLKRAKWWFERNKE